MNEVTRPLDEIALGDPRAAERLLLLVYEELRKLAARLLAAEQTGQTLQATALALDAALTRLATENPQAAKLVELRHFAGLSVAEAAEILEISPRTADRVWAFARAWLHRELTDTAADPKL